MKPSYFEVKRLIFILLMLFFSVKGFSATVTAVTSGDWTSSSTWGGATPQDGDLIIIPGGITVTIPDYIIVDLTGAGTTVIRIEDGGTLSLGLLSTLLLDSGDGDKIVLVTENSTLNNTWIDFYGTPVPASFIFMGATPYYQETTTGPAVLQDGVLPIELLYFRAGQEGNTVLLEWATSLEENFDFFTVERSTDGINFEKIADIYGAGNTDEKQYYSYTDDNPFPGNLYYRLKATDFDGTFEYFKIISVRYFGEESYSVTLYPNPVVNGKANLRLNYRPDGPVSVVIYDQMGRQFLKRSLSGTSGILELPSGMRPGIYLMHIIDDEHKIQTRLNVR